MSEAPTAAEPVAQPPAWYCPGCGERYFGPGTCANNHPPLDLLKDPAVTAADPTAAETAANDPVAAIPDAAGETTGEVALSEAEPTDATEETAVAPVEQAASPAAPPSVTPAEAAPAEPNTETAPVDEAAAPPAVEEAAPAAVEAPAPVEPVAPTAAEQSSLVDQARKLVQQAADLLAQL